VSNYQELDRDPQWHRWLSSSDPLTVRPRQVAIARSDASRVKAFFQGFQQEAGGTQAPGRARSASAKPTYTRDQIARLYEQDRKGAYAGREAEWNRIEADIFAAQKEGRVQAQPYLTK
jgi:hypothetical protein